MASFTFGCPDARLCAVCTSRRRRVGHGHERGGGVAAREAGADGLVVQGTEAGGHRGGFEDDGPRGGVGLLALLRLVARATPLALIATGGIADGAGLAAALCAGARAAQVGTALMLAPRRNRRDPRALHALRRPTA